MKRGGLVDGWLDALLGFAPLTPPALRLRFARRAAARGLGAAALRAAPDDAWVLSRLGLHATAVETRGGGARADLARLASTAALGRTSGVVDWMDRLATISVGERRYLAAAVAPTDARLALALLPASDAESRAACALSLGDLGAARGLLSAATPTQQSRYLSAALAARQADLSPHDGAWRDARALLNLAFAADGLAPPLDERLDEPSTLDALGDAGPLPGKDAGPLISVIMAARNAERTLAAAAGSMLAQTWRNLEVIVVDDGSTDGTAGVAKAMADRDSRLTVIANTQGPGAYGARNTGVAAARGGIVALQDADDWAHPQRLERQMVALRGGAGLALCRHIRLDTDGVPVCPRVFPFVRLSPITMTARKEAFTAIGPFEEVSTGADSEWVARYDQRFGRRAGPRMAEVGLVALWAAGSLSAAPSSGLMGEGAAARSAYVETWRRRHAAAWHAPFAPAGNRG